jgi:hypothetical protein
MSGRADGVGAQFNALATFGMWASAVRQPRVPRDLTSIND